ncbi:glycoside hydrolase family 3 C-terminal domain-containing protein [Paenibacillus phoenicis]|uniref:glycoside hydrolase family 3 C-terminal domain-containing protein n=1 Tax=Paenibacillus phoenicis TaxID=554117 RepID=UPI003D290693
MLGGSSAREFGGEFEDNGAAIVKEGSPSDMDCGEGVDLADLSLSGVQLELAEAVAATGTPVVAVIIQGRPHALGEVVELCDAVLCAWYPGTEGGRAIAEILFGKVNPSGKLPVTLPRSSAQLPIYYNQKDPGRIRNYVDMPSAPLYPFGYGLSYTQFIYAKLSLSRTAVSTTALENGERVMVQVEVKNTGARSGAETVQLYIRARESGITRRIAELKGFTKIELAPGEIRTVEFSLGREELGIWTREMRFATVPCKVTVIVGGSSQAALSADLTVTV